MTPSARPDLVILSRRTVHPKACASPSCICAPPSWHAATASAPARSSLLRSHPECFPGLNASSRLHRRDQNGLIRSGSQVLPHVQAFESSAAAGGEVDPPAGIVACEALPSRESSLLARGSKGGPDFADRVRPRCNGGAFSAMRLTRCGASRGYRRVRISYRCFSMRAIRRSSSCRSPSLTANGKRWRAQESDFRNLSSSRQSANWYVRSAGRTSSIRWLQSATSV